jgi:hypothetical protein
MCSSCHSILADKEQLDYGCRLQRGPETRPDIGGAAMWMRNKTRGIYVGVYWSRVLSPILKIKQKNSKRSKC